MYDVLRQFQVSYGNKQLRLIKVPKLPKYGHKSFRDEIE